MRPPGGAAGGGSGPRGGCESLAPFLLARASPPARSEATLFLPLLYSRSILADADRRVPALPLREPPEVDILRQTVAIQHHPVSVGFKARIKACIVSGPSRA